MRPFRPKNELGLTSQENIRTLVIAGQKAIRGNAVEKDFPLHPLEGSKGRGFFYTVTDKTYKTPVGIPVPGEYPILTHGELGLGDLILSFSIFSDVKDDVAVREALTMLRGATRVGR